MKPFSARYFLLHNRARALCIIFMISMLSLAYVGGLYLTNISEESRAITDELKDFVYISDTISDKDGVQLKALVQEMESDDSIEIFHIGSNYYQYKTILGFDNGSAAYSFTKEDFARFNKRVHIFSEDAELTENSILLSKREAALLKVEDGDMFDNDDTDKLEIYWGEGPFKVRTFDRNVLSAYFILDDISASGNYLITWKDASVENEFYQKVDALKSSYDMVRVSTYQDRINSFAFNFEINNIIYYSIIAILTIVCAITINAVLVGLYDKRKQEFLIYQGIGMGTFKICRKIIAEILIMNGLGLIFGGLISIIVVSSLNYFVYAKDGIHMWYYHKTAFIAVCLCDLAILIPGIGLRILSVYKDMKTGLY